MDRLVDRKALLDRVDGDLGFLEESLELLESHGRGLLNELRAASVSGDRNSLISKAHTLKGMVSNFCAQPVLEAAEEIEQRARDGALEEISLQVGDFVTRFERLCLETRAIVSGEES